MGCDIHVRVETRDTEGRWRRVAPTPGTVEYSDAHPLERGGLRPLEDREIRYHPVNGDPPIVTTYRGAWDLARERGFPRKRDYRVFSLLSGVRSPFPGMFDRGLPDDADLVGTGEDSCCHDDPRSVDSHTPDHAMLHELAALGQMAINYQDAEFFRWVLALSERFDPKSTRVIWWFDN